MNGMELWDYLWGRDFPFPPLAALIEEATARGIELHGTQDQYDQQYYIAEKYHYG